MLNMNNINLSGNIEVLINSSLGDLTAFTDVIYTQALPPKPKNPKTTAGFSIPEIHHVRKDDWGKGFFINDENDTSYLISTEDTSDLYVNMDCKYLINQIASDPDNKKLYEFLWITTCMLLWGLTVMLRVKKKKKLKKF